MAEIDRIVVLDIERDGSSSTTAEQEMIILRNDLASTDPTKGAGMVGYRSSESYSGDTVGKALTDIESNMSAVEDSASQALTKSNEALAKATTAESRIDNALLKGNNLSDIVNKVAALDNIGAVALSSITESPSSGKTPKAGSDGLISQDWIRDLKYQLASIQKSFNDLKYPDGIVPDIDWDFTSGAAPSGLFVSRGSPATYCNKNGIMRTAVINEPIFEYDYETGKCLGLRKEYSSTNVMQYSNYNPTYWGILGNDAGVQERYGISPEGDNNSSLLTSTNSAGSVPFVARRYISYEGSTDYTTSVFFKINSSMVGKIVGIVLHGDVFGNSKRVLFKVDTGETYTRTDPLLQPKKFGVIRYSNNWVRVWLTDTVKDGFTGEGYSPLIWFETSVNPGEGVEFWGMQVEKGTAPTSLIQTNGSEVTRLGDSLSYALPRKLETNQMTILVDSHRTFVSHGVLPHSAGFCAVLGQKGNSNNYIGVGYSTRSIADTDTQMFYRKPGVDSSDILSLTNVVDPLTRRIRAAFTTAIGERSMVSVNGTTVQTGQLLGTHDIYDYSDNISFGGDPTGNSNTYFLGHISQFQIYPRKMTSDKLIEMSSI